MKKCRDCKTYDHCRQCYAGRRLTAKTAIPIILLVTAICALLMLLFGDPSEAAVREAERRAAAESAERRFIIDVARAMDGGGH